MQQRQFITKPCCCIFWLLDGKRHVLFSVDEFVAAFHAKLDKITMLDVKDELKEYFLLKQAILDSHKTNIVIGCTGGKYFLQELSLSLRNIYRDESPPLSSMASNIHEKHWIASIRKLHHYSGSSTASKVSESRWNNKEPPLFYTDVSARPNEGAVATVIDARACPSVVGKTTLEKPCID